MRKPLPVNLQSSNLTKGEIANRAAEEKKLKGNSTKVYRAPTHLSNEEKKLYRFLVKELKESDILNNLDITILEITVDAIIKMRECKREIDEYGIVVMKKSGPSKNPAINAFKDYNAIYNKCCMEIGLSPSARARLASINVQKKTKEGDPLLKALRKK